MTSSAIYNISKARNFTFTAFLFFLPLLGEHFRINNLYHISFGLLLLSLFVDKQLRQELIENKPLLKGIIAMGAFLFYFSLSNLWSSNPENITSTLKHSFYIIGFVILFSQINKKLAYSVLFASIVILCLLNFWFVDKTHIFTNRTANGFFAAPDNVIDLAGYFGLGIFFGLLLIRETGKHIFYIPISILFIAMLLTQSRGPVLALIVACMPLLLRFQKSHARHALVAVVILIIIAILGYFTHYNDQLISRFLNAYKQSFIRFGIWEQAINLSLQKPWFGWGFDKQLSFINSIKQHIHTTHSIYFSALLKGGFIGLFTLLTMIGYGLYRAKLHFKGGQAIEASLILFSLMFFLTQGMFIIGNPDIYWVNFWLPFAVILTSVKQN